MLQSLLEMHLSSLHPSTPFGSPAWDASVRVQRVGSSTVRLLLWSPENSTQQEELPVEVG